MTHQSLMSHMYLNLFSQFQKTLEIFTNSLFDSTAIIVCPAAKIYIEDARNNG
jgi:hypothetical protein